MSEETQAEGTRVEVLDPEAHPQGDFEPPQVVESGPPISEFLTPHKLDEFEKTVELFKRFTVSCYKYTRPTHWIKQGKKYCLQGPGAEALMNPLGISYEPPEFVRQDGEDEDGKSFYIIWCYGSVASRALGRHGYYIGSCDSRDQFFSARPGWNPGTGEPDVKKSAMTNWCVNAVSRLAGIRDPDPETLKAAGIDLAAIPAPDYSGRKTPEDDTRIISDAQRKRLWAIAKRAGVSEESLKRFLSDNYNLQDTKKILRKDYNAICDEVEKGLKNEPAD